MRRRVVIASFGAAVVVIAALVGIYLGTPQPVTATGFAMGSVLTQTHWRKIPGLTALDVIPKLEAELLEATQPPPLALEIMEASGGAFNPYLGALVKLWDIDGQGYVPTQAEIDAALQKCELDLGAYGKGAACDAALDYDLKYYKAVLLNLGGNILTHGQKPFGQPFKIALRDPKGGQGDTLGVFTLRGTHFISTSGSYEKYFERDGKRFHHIFDPETGRPAERDPGLVSVTVVSKHGATGDAVSTACFVLGFENSLALLREYECEAIFIYEDGAMRFNEPTVPKKFEITNPSYHWS